MSLKTSAVNRYGLLRSFMNTRNRPSLVIRSFILLNFKSDDCFFFAERTAKIQIGDLKSRVDTCQKDCASLKDSFYGRVHLDTNTRVRRMMKEMKDDKLGAFELHSSIN